MNLLTDLAPGAGDRAEPAGPGVHPELLREGPSASLGAALTRDMGTRAGTTTLGATAAWTLARLTGRRRAGTVALAALVGLAVNRARQQAQ